MFIVSAEMAEQLAAEANALIGDLADKDHYHAIVLIEDGYGYPRIALIDTTDPESTNCRYAVMIGHDNDLSDDEIADGIDFPYEFARVERQPDPTAPVLGPPRVSDIVVNDRRVGDYASLLSHPRRSCDHRLGAIVGYVVRETVRDGEVLPRHPYGPGCGVDVYVVDEAGGYARTFPVRDSYRTSGGYAVVDNLYRCGCRGF